jgi:GNAT superfamily N-acetyltransferase
VTGWRITSAEPEDAGPLAQILGDWVRETGWMPVLHSREEDARFVAGLIASHEVRVARGDRGALGFIVLSESEIPAFYLAADARGRGIGKALLSDAKVLRPRLSLWLFAANERAERFYLREGFREVERTDGQGNDESLPDIRMVWERET